MSLFLKHDTLAINFSIVEIKISIIWICWPFRGLVIGPHNVANKVIDQTLQKGLQHHIRAFTYHH